MVGSIGCHDAERKMKPCRQATLADDGKYSRHAWYNGEIVNREQGAPSVASASFHLGTSVFDGIMAYWNRDHYYIHRGEEHLARFRRGAELMGLAFAWSVEEMLWHRVPPPRWQAPKRWGRHPKAMRELIERWAPA